MDQWVINERSKALVHAIIGIRAGWRHETDRKRGITHFLEHALLLGNDSYPSPDIESWKRGIQISGMTNPEHTLFWSTSTKEDFQEVFRLLLSLVFHPHFNEDKIEKEKHTKIIPAVVHETDFTAWELAYEWAMNLTFDWDFFQSLGVEKDIVSLTKENLMAWHKRYYGSPNSFVVISGDVGENKVAGIVEEADVPSNAEKPSPLQHHWNKKQIFVERNGMKNTEVVYGFRLPHYDVRYEILNIVLCRYPLGKLWRDAFCKFSFTTSSKLEWTSTSGGLFVNFAANSCGNVSEIDKNLWQLLRDFDIEERELEAAKKAMLLKMLLAKEGGEQTLLNFVRHPSVFIQGSHEKMLREVKQVDKTQMLTLANSCLNEQNAVRVLVGSRE